jgi:hypothetical protein
MLNDDPHGGQLVIAVAQRKAALAVALSQPIVMAGASGAGTTDTYGNSATLEANQITAANVLIDRMWLRTLTRSAQAAAARMEKSFGLAPGFHHLVDPLTVKHAATLIIEDYFSATIVAGACGVVFGFAEHITPGDPTTLVGVGFKCGPDHIWHAFVNDCPTNVAPVTVRRDTAIAGKLSTDLHRLAVIIDGPTKTISWLIDGAIVDTWKPPAPLDQMTATGPKMLWAASVPINGNVTIRYHGGGIPQVRLLVR